MSGMAPLTFGSVTFGVLLCLQGRAFAQVTPSAAIPSTAPTQSVSDLPSAQPAFSSAARGGSHVAWNGVFLTIEAGGDSLRNILMQVMRATGMKVTGGVPEEQVFGSYGPGPVQGVLGSLFNGLNVNMLLVNGPATPKELVLTARLGGPTPPSPAQPLNVQAVPTAQVQPDPGPRTPPGNLGPGSQENQPGIPPPGGVNPNGAAATDPTGQPQSPNGVRTPEQIFDELRRRQGRTTTQ